MGIKGSATIELTNADGSKEIYKHDNMITNAVNDLCTSQRGEMATILKIVDNGDSYAQALFGGLLLFDETLNSDANDYFLPTVKCTGYASQDAYAGLDTCRGNFNASEGGVQADGSYKFVWDFATSQANGTIKSLALCPNMMGQIGLTSSKVLNESKKFYMKRTNVEPFNTDGYMISSNVDGFPAVGIFVIAVKDDIAYAVSRDNIGYRGGSASASLCIKNNGWILKLLRFKLGASSIALTDKVCKATYIDTVDVQLPSEFTSTLNTSSTYAELINFSFIQPEGKIVMFPSERGSDTQVNDTIKYCEIDVINNYSVTTYTFTNNTAGYIPSSSYHDTNYSNCKGNTFPFFVMRNYILCVSIDANNDSRVCIVKRSDNTQVKLLCTLSNDVVKFFNTTRIRPIFWSDNIVCILFQDNSSTASASHCKCVDFSTGYSIDTNISSITQYDTVYTGNYAVFASTGIYLRYSMTFNPFILCTKNNLDSPVTKTASQTMKITYTLSVADTAGSEV